MRARPVAQGFDREAISPRSRQISQNPAEARDREARKIALDPHSAPRLTNLLTHVILISVRLLALDDVIGTR